MSAAAQIGDLALGSELIQAASSARMDLQRNAAEDQRVLADSYRRMPTDHLTGAMQRARDSLQEVVNLFDSSVSSDLQGGEKQRFRNLYMNARDKADLGLSSLRDDLQKQNVLGDQSPFRGLLPAPNSNPLARTPELAEIFGTTLPEAAAATSNDSLVNRLVMFNGLPSAERERMLKSLRLAEKAPLTLPNGGKVSVPILHNGYLLGGGNGVGGAGSGTDCSAFVSSVLPADVRKGRFTSLDFRTMWVYRRRGSFPNDPTYTAARRKVIQETSTAFTALDIYSGDRLGVGDLLVFRPLYEPIGHVFIVKNINPVNMVTEVIEASQSAGTLREREFPLSMTSPGALKRVLRPGLMALRLRPTDNRACSYKEHRSANQKKERSGFSAPEGTSGAAL